MCYKLTCIDIAAEYVRVFVDISMNLPLLHQCWKLYLDGIACAQISTHGYQWPSFKVLACACRTMRTLDLSPLWLQPADRAGMCRLWSFASVPAEQISRARVSLWGVKEFDACFEGVADDDVRRFLGRLLLNPSMTDSPSRAVTELRSLSRRLGVRRAQGFPLYQMANLLALRFPTDFYFIPPPAACLAVVKKLKLYDMKLAKSYRTMHAIESVVALLKTLAKNLIPQSLETIYRIALRESIPTDVCIRILLADFIVFFSQETRAPSLNDEMPHGFRGLNLIVYGVPGSGKSYYVRQKIPAQARVIQTVFHPGMTYADFIGQVKPRSGGDNGDKPVYPFVAGPFTQAMKEALTRPSEACYLIIEEINRGDAPAIFGDMFQLLDRNEAYSVNNEEVAEELYGKDKRHMGITLPPNLFLIATMNTSDQGIFPLDSAFQRRWLMYPVSNDFEKEQDSGQCNAYILDTGTTWRHFCTVINEEIVKANAESPALEDKRLGVYFTKKKYFDESDTVKGCGVAAWDEIRMDRPKLFAAKVLRYLWDDAFRMERQALFKPEFRIFDEVMTKFLCASGEGRFRIFTDEVYSRLKAKQGRTRK